MDVIEKMKKVLIIGGNGSGKTTMARELSEITGLPLCHLDTLYWTDNWQPRKREEFDQLLRLELEKPLWILDGNMRRTIPMRLGYCDTVIYLDFSGIRCFFGTLSRLFKSRGKSRPDMGGECVEKLDLRSLKFVFSTLSFNRRNRSYIYGAIAEHPEVKTVILKSRRQVRRFLEDIENEYCDRGAKTSEAVPTDKGYFCPYLGRRIDEGLCYDVQMISEGCIKPCALSEITVDKAKVSELCAACEYKIKAE